MYTYADARAAVQHKYRAMRSVQCVQTRCASAHATQSRARCLCAYMKNTHVADERVLSERSAARGANSCVHARKLAQGAMS